MRTSPISFGRVVVVSGNKSKLDRLDTKVKYHKSKIPVVVKDVTSVYKNDTGYIANAANNGDSVRVYLSGPHARKANNREEGWTSDVLILSHMQDYFSAKKTSLDDIIDRIFKM